MTAGNGWLEKYVRDNVERHDREFGEVWTAVNENKDACVSRDQALDRQQRDTRWMLVLYATGGGFAGNALWSLASEFFRSLAK